MDGFDIVPATTEELVSIDGKLDAFNAQQTGFDDSQPLGLSVRDRDGHLVGGLKGSTGLRWLYIAVLWLEESHRGRGLGAALLGRAEELARERGCLGVCLTSFSFQAPGFYQRNGYEIFGELDDYPPGEKLVFLRKTLA